jgi:hypothetical protein
MNEASSHSNEGSSEALNIQPGRTRPRIHIQKNFGHPNVEANITQACSSIVGGHGHWPETSGCDISSFLRDSNSISTTKLNVDIHGHFQVRIFQ